MRSQAENQIIEVEDTKGENLSLSGNVQRPSAQVGEVAARGDEGDMRAVFRALMDRKWFILSLTMLAALASILYTLSITPVYRAEAILKIDPEETNVLEFDVSTSGSDTKTEQYFRTQERLLKSKALARKVIDHLEINDLLASQLVAPKKPFYEGALERVRERLGLATAGNLQSLSESVETDRVKPSDVERLFISHLEVQPQGKSYLMKLAYHSVDPELSASVINALADNYIKMNLESRVDSASHAKSFLGEELDEARQKLQESERVMIDFEREHGIVNSGSSGNLLTNQKLQSLNLALTKATQDRIAAESAFNAPGTQTSVPVRKRAQPSPRLQGLQDELKALQARYQENRKIYKPAYPLMQEIQAQIDTVNASIAAERKAVRDQQAELDREYNAALGISSGGKNALEARIRAARANEAALKAELERAKEEAIASRDNAIKYASLEKNVQTNRQLYESLEKRQKEVGIAEGVDKNNISVIDPAVAPLGPYKPNMQVNLGVGTLMGLLLGSLLAIVMGHVDQRVKSSADIEKVTDLPVLGIFPLVKAKARKKGAILVTEHPNSNYAEAFRTLRTNLMFVTPEGLPRILHVTSSEPSEGKSNTALNLAAVFAQSQKSVLLIDADLRKPSLHRFLELSGSKGLGDYLQHGVPMNEVETRTFIPGVTVIAGRAIESTPADLLSSDRMVKLLDRASDKYDLVIIDSPPVMGLADSLVLANRSTATLIAVASHETKQSQITATLNRLRMGYGNVVGFVLTKARKVKSAEYRYEYGNEHLAAVNAGGKQGNS